MIRRTLLVTLIIVAFGLNAFSQAFTLNFEKPQVLNNGGFLEIRYDEISNGGAPGEPALPVITHNELLPQGTEVSYAQVISISYYSETASGIIMPVQTPVPISMAGEDLKFTAPDPDIYNQTTAFPESVIRNHMTNFLGGHGIATFNICPVEYIPAENNIRFVKSVTIGYKTAGSEKDICLASKSDAVYSRIKNLVDNPEVASTYNYAASKDGNADMLIISKADFLPLMEEYINYKESTGFFTEVISTEDILATYDGQDDQEKIRNCIKDYYENYGIEYVILVGDADPANEDQNIIPHRGLKAVDDYDIPADLYYSNLDGNWDENGNGVWGQIGEGDLFAEVAIGRFSVDSPAEIANMIHKHIMYQDHPVADDGNKFLLVGENLNNNPLTWGGTYMDELYYGTSNHGFTTAAISDDVETSRIYDRDGTWNPTMIRDHFNTSGLNFLNHLGHSNVTYNMKMNNEDLTTQAFRNDGIDRGFCLGYSQGCYNGSFDNRNTNGGHGSGDSFAEKITTMETADVACVANSRYGWYMPANTNSSSQFYNRYFFHALFGMDITQIGWANAYSKEAEVSWLDGEYFRWTAYELNLFGDPSLDIYTAKPVEMLASIPGTIIEGTTEIPFTSDASYARIAVLLNNELLCRTFADENGEAVITLPSPAIDGQEYQISVIAHNKLRYQQSINVTVNSPVIICTESVVNDSEFNGNGIADFGETISLNLTFKNTGDVSCNNAVFNVVSNCEHINFTQNTTETGVLEPGQEITIENAFSAEISPYIAPKDVIIAISSGQAKEWSSSFILPVGGAVPVISDFLVEEISNDPNGRVDPGESATLYYTLENNGNAPIENLRISIEARDIFVTCQEPELTIEELGAGETFTFSFDIETDEETPDGFTSFIGFEMTADRGLLFEQDNFTFIGLPGILICDLDKNHNSAQKIMSDLKAAGASAEYSDFIPENINDFDAIFLCLGIFPDYHDVSEEEGQIFADYLNQGGKLYMESGSFWYFNDHTPLHDMMQIESAIGNGWIYGNEELVGIESTFGEGMEFGYTGDNLRIDHLEVTEPTYLVFNSEPHTFGAMAALETDTYKAIATTFEWSGIIPANSSTSTEGLMTEIIDFMELNTAKPPVVDLGADTTICVNQQLILDAGDGYSSYLWSTGETTSTITVDTSMFPQMINEISVTVVNQDGYKASDAIVIAFDDCTGIDNNTNHSLTIYPNPASEVLNISFPEKSFSYALMDISGKTICESENNFHQATINTKSLKQNVYLLIIRTDDDMKVQKVFIK